MNIFYQHKLLRTNKNLEFSLFLFFARTHRTIHKATSDIEKDNEQNNNVLKSGNKLLR